MKMITISREFESGGRESGKRLADSRGVAGRAWQLLQRISLKGVTHDNSVIRSL